MATVTQRYLEDYPEFGNESQEESHLKHFLALDVRENLPNDFGDYMDFAFVAAEKVPSRSEDLLGYAFDISEKYFSPESLKDKTADFYRLNILENMGKLSRFLIKYGDNPNHRIPQHGVRVNQQVDRLPKMVTGAASWFGGRCKNVEDKANTSNDAVDWRYNIIRTANYYVSNFTPGGDEYKEKNQNDMLLALGNLPKGKMDDYCDDMTRILGGVYKQRHQLPNNEQSKVFNELEQKTGVDGSEIFAELYQKDKKWLKENDAFIQRCDNKDDINCIDMGDAIDGVFSDKWRRQRAFRTINAIEKNVRNHLNDGDSIPAYRFMLVVGERPNISSNDVFFAVGQDRLAALASDIIRNDPEFASQVMDTYANIHRKRPIKNNDDYLFVEATAKNANKSRVQAAKERILKRRAEKQAAIDTFNKNKNKKFYTVDDLEFDIPEDSRDHPQAKMQFENGWGVSVLDKTINGRKHDGEAFDHDHLYEVAVLDKDGYLDSSTDITPDYGFGYRDPVVAFGVGKEDLNEILKTVQKLDADGKLPKEYSEAENAVSGVVVADKIAELQIADKVRNTITPNRGQKLSDSIKRKYFQNKRQKD